MLPTLTRIFGRIAETVFLRNLPELLNLRLVGLEKVIGKCIRILSTIVFVVVSYYGHSTGNVDFTSDCADYP